jgi:hypothetical protein
MIGDLWKSSAYHRRTSDTLAARGDETGAPLAARTPLAASRVKTISPCIVSIYGP